MIGSVWSLEVRRRSPGLSHSGGRRGRMSGADGETLSDGGRRSPSGRMGSGGGEDLGSAGGVEERETCGNKRLSIKQFKDN